MRIDPRFIDVDFEQHARVDGYQCGAMPRKDLCGSAFPVLEEDPNFRVIPREERTGLIARQRPLRPLVQKIKDQGQEGSCASNAAAQVYEVAHTLHVGLDDWIELSPMSLYKRVARSAQSGSVIGDNLQELVDRGILPVDNAENRARFTHVHPATGFARPLPSGWEATASLFRVTEWFDISSWDGLASALLYKYPVLYGRAGHAIAGIDLVEQDGEEFIQYANSWGQWGDQGFGYDSRRAVESAIPGYGAWCARVVQFVADSPLPALATSIPSSDLVGV
jgi:hypothetical protein